MAPSATAADVPADVPANDLGIRLLVPREASDGPGFGAGISGVLGLSPSRCVTVAGEVILAPFGSAVIGNRLHLVGLGDFALGDRVASAGGGIETRGFTDATRPLGLEFCNVTTLLILNPGSG